MFPGKQFISTVLDLLDAKTAMTGQVAQRYLMRAAMAGVIVGIFYTAYYTIVAGFDEISVGEGNLHVVGKFLGALVFGWALVFIYYSKSELLTSNMMITSIGVYYHRTGVKKALTLLALCFMGNFLGGLLIAVLVAFTSLLNGDTTAAMQEAVDSKLGYYTDGLVGMTDLFFRAVLCNFMINLAMLLVYNGTIKSDVLKALVMIMSVFVFAFLAFEHSVANTVLFLTHGLNTGIDAVGATVVVIISLLGNFVGGGVLIGLYYAYINDEGRYLRHHPAEEATDAA
ncbi:MAG: hypothetical protein QG597_3570 [Actinomycetota bacterium]|nr:hypothetical protein [Actinomycetota bacterium]